MQKITPTPRTWTLRFKNHCSTVLLEVDPLQNFSDVRAELLHAITMTNPSGKLNGKEIPKTADHIMLGRAVDRNNLSLGYTRVDEDVKGETLSGKSKGKSTVTAIEQTAAIQLKNCPQGAQFRNGDVVAFRFMDDEDEEDDEDEVEKWDVIVPTMEETYGETEQDEGVALEVEE